MSHVFMFSMMCFLVTFRLYLIIITVDTFTASARETVLAPPKYNLSRTSPPQKEEATGTKLPYNQVVRQRRSYGPPDKSRDSRSPGPNSGSWRKRADSDPPSGQFDLPPRSPGNKNTNQGRYRRRNGSYSPKARHRKESPKSFRRSLFEANISSQLT